MKLFSYIVTYPDGKLSSVSEELFGSEGEVTEALQQLFGWDYRIVWDSEKKYYRLHDRSYPQSHRLNIYIVDYNY